MASTVWLPAMAAAALAVAIAWLPSFGRGPQATPSPFLPAWSALPPAEQDEALDVMAEAAPAEDLAGLRSAGPSAAACRSSARTRRWPWPTRCGASSGRATREPRLAAVLVLALGLPAAAPPRKTNPAAAGRPAACAPGSFRMIDAYLASNLQESLGPVTSSSAA